MEAYDDNKDGKIEIREVRKIPALKKHFKFPSHRMMTEIKLFE